MKLKYALWADRICTKRSIGTSPYELVYGKNPLFPIEFEIKTLRTTLQVNLDLATTQKQRLNQLNELEEKWLAVIQQIDIIQQQRAKWHDKFIKKKQFQKGYWALLYDSRFKDFKCKLCTIWLGPYEVDAVFDNGTVNLVTIDSARRPLLANGHHLWLYHKPTLKGSFVNIVTNSDLQVIGTGESPPVLQKF